MTTGATESEFRVFLTEDWERWLSELPELATSVGRRGLDDRWTDDSAEGIEARRKHLETAWTGSERFGAEKLSREDRLSYELYREQLADARHGLRFGQDSSPFRFGSPRSLRMPLNQVDGVHLYAPDVLMMQPRATVEDYRIVVRRLGGLAKAIDQQVELLKGGIAAGWTPPQITLRDVPNQLTALAPANARESALLQPFVEFPPSIPEAERSGLFASAEEEFLKSVVPALGRLRTYFVESYLPQCRTAVGASSLPGGPEWYRYLVAWQTTTSMTPEQIHELGQKEVDRLQGEMEKIRADVAFAGSLDEFKGWLRSDPKFFPPTAEAMLAAYRGLAKKIDPELTHLFGRLPRLPYGVLPIPGYRAQASPTAYYYSGAGATGRAGYFYVNTYDLPARPIWEMEALTLHEAVPGHHLQFALMEEYEQLPEFRRHSGYTAFVEGWGLYAESLGSELGLYRDPFQRFGQLSMDAWRSARLVVDTGMHALGWSRDRAIDYLLNATGKSRTDVVAEVDRYIVWPGQALAYKVGQLRLRAARTRAERTLGARFDVRRFHDFLLGDGGLPLDRLDERLNGWLATSPTGPDVR